MKMKLRMKNKMAKKTKTKSPKKNAAPEPVSGDSRIVKCPQCKKDSVYSLQNPSRPFCSERCKLLDLGEWASENYRIAKGTNISEEEEIPEDEEKIN